MVPAAAVIAVEAVAPVVPAAALTPPINRMKRAPSCPAPLFFASDPVSPWFAAAQDHRRRLVKGYEVKILMWIGVAAGAIVPTGAEGKNLGIWIVQCLLYPGIDIVIQVIAIVI